MKIYTRPVNRISKNSSDYFVSRPSAKALNTVAKFLGYRVYGLYGGPTIIDTKGTILQSYRVAPRGSQLVYTQLAFYHHPEVPV